MKIKRALIAVLFVCIGTSCILADDSYFTDGPIFLYNQEDVFGERSADVETLASFIKKVNAEAASLCKKDKKKEGRSGFITVAIRPDRTVKIWVDIEDEYQPEITKKLQKKIDKTGVPQVRYGPIAFALHFDLWGGNGQPLDENSPLKIPQLWREAAENHEGKLLLPDDFLPLVWEEKALEKAPEFYVPEGYDLQIMEPTGGKILKPKGWFYYEGHRSSESLMWTISKENLDEGPYETGMKIQCFVGVEEQTGTSPKDFVMNVVNGKKSTTEVVSIRPEEDQGMFSRIGIETIENIPHADGTDRPYHILYSCFWGNRVDIVIITISGTTPELWDEYVKFFDAMSAFELIGADKLK